MMRRVEGWTVGVSARLAGAVAVRVVIERVWNVHCGMRPEAWDQCEREKGRWGFKFE